MRKLAAIMFTDIVVYSVLMSKYESLALGILDKNRRLHQSALKQHNGELIKEIGDGTLAIFHSSWDAVTCAMTLQDTLSHDPSYRLRIGIHIGDIVATESDVFGDGVNIASRIQTLCEPGGICFTERVYEDILNKTGLNIQCIGTKSLKNIEHPVKLYAISLSSIKEKREIKMPAWQQAAKHDTLEAGQRKDKKTKIRSGVVTAVVILLVLIAVAIIIKSYFPGILYAREPTPIAVVSFENQTGDASFDYLQKAIPNLLITNLEHSRFFRVMTWERMQDLLRQMGQDSVSTIGADLGFELCRRAGCHIIVIGSYVKAGDVFVTDAKVLDVSSKQMLSSVSAKGTGVSSILESQIDDLSREISRTAGISKHRIETGDLHVTDVTTSSMEAYQYFLKGVDASEKMYHNDARKYFEAAVRLDSTFAVAWFYLSQTYESLMNYRMRDEAINKAYAASWRATEQEQLTIKANYARVIKHDSDEELRLWTELVKVAPDQKRAHFALGFCLKSRDNLTGAIEQFNEAIGLDPDYGAAYNQAAYLYAKQGNYEKALSYFNRYASINPDDANPYDSMGDLLWRMGRLDEAIAQFKKALDLKPDFYDSASKLSYLYFMKEDYPEGYQWIDKSIDLSPSQGTKAKLFCVRASFDNWCGDVNQTRTDLAKAREITSTSDSSVIVPLIYWMKIVNAVDHDRNDLDKKFYLNLLKDQREARLYNSSDSAGNFLLKGIIYMVLNKDDSARMELGRVESLLPGIPASSRSQYAYWYDYVYGSFLLKEKNFLSALDILEKLKLPEIPYFMYPDVLNYNIPSLRNAKAEAYVGLNRIDDAIAEYERLIGFDPKSDDRRLIHPKNHYYLGRLYEEKGLKEKAVDQYRTFLTLWKNASDVYPEPADARKRLEKLTQNPS